MILIRMLLIALAAFVAQLFLPWWIIVPLSFLVLFILPTPKAYMAFLTAFFALYLLYACAMAYISIGNDHILAKRIASLFFLPQASYNWLLLVLVSALPHAMIAALAALGGQYARMLKKK